MQARDRNRADQAAFVVAVLLPLAGCVGSGWPDPINFSREVSGTALDRRLSPPGLDLPHPHLGLVPPRPERPDSATLAAITRALTEDRAQAAQPLEPGGAPLAAMAPVPGRLPIPGGPPPPPTLARAPAVGWDGPGGVAVSPIEREGPRAGQELAPGAVPALPTPDLLAPAAPAVPMAPGAVPPLPPPDLLAPRR
jgi:hypothetical protein